MSETFRLKQAWEQLRLVTKHKNFILVFCKIIFFIRTIVHPCNQRTLHVLEFVSLGEILGKNLLPDSRQT